MLAFKYRFHGHGSLRYVYRNGQALRTRLLVVKHTKNPRRKDPRFAVVVSKKVLKSAVGRNRIRRRVYETVRRTLNEEVTARDIVLIITSSEIINLPQSELDQLIISLLHQTSLYKNASKTGIIIEK